MILAFNILLNIILLAVIKNATACPLVGCRWAGGVLVGRFLQFAAKELSGTPLPSVVNGSRSVTLR
jgi:hypothetical protein